MYSHDIISFMNFGEKMKMLYLDDIETILLNLEQKYLDKKISYEIYAEKKNKQLELIYRIFHDDLDCYITERFLKTIYRIQVNSKLEKEIMELLLSKSLLLLFQINRVDFGCFLKENNREDILDIFLIYLTEEERKIYENHVRSLLMK